MTSSMRWFGTGQARLRARRRAAPPARNVVIGSERFKISRRGRGSRRRLDRNHLESMHVAVFVADRDVFTRLEGVRGKPVARLVVLRGGLVIIEYPTAVLRPPRLVHQPTDPLVLAPKPAHTAMLSMPAPEVHIDVSVRSKRGDELVTMLRGSGREFLRTGEVEADALELVRQLGHANILLGRGQCRDSSNVRQIYARDADLAQLS